MPNITLPDGSVKKYNQMVSIADVAKDIGEGLGSSGVSRKNSRSISRFEL
jgi:hypothetical protein